MLSETSRPIIFFNYIGYKIEEIRGNAYTMCPNLCCHPRIFKIEGYVSGWDFYVLNVQKDGVISSEMCI